MVKIEKYKWDGKEIWISILMLPVIFFLMIGMYLVLSKLSLKYSRVCTFMGKIWISEAESTSIKPDGCYTYRQLGEIKFVEDDMKLQEEK